MALRTMSLNVTQVFFCSPSSKPLLFRQPLTSDYLGSHLRAHIFDSLSDREVNLNLIRGDLASEDSEKYILKDENNQLMAWQISGALEHWRGMWTLHPH